MLEMDKNQKSFLLVRPQSVPLSYWNIFVKAFQQDLNKVEEEGINNSNKFEEDFKLRLSPDTEDIFSNLYQIIELHYSDEHRKKQCLHWVQLIEAIQKDLKIIEQEGAEDLINDELNGYTLSPTTAHALSNVLYLLAFSDSS